MNEMFRTTQESYGYQPPNPHKNEGGGQFTKKNILLQWNEMMKCLQSP